MAHYDIYREKLSIKYPAYGHALWEPTPGEGYSAVEVGDVGYMRDGRFHRLFNALLSADHPSQTFGVPESYEPILQVLNPSKDIDNSTLKPNHYYSYGISGISVADTKSDVRASESEEDAVADPNARDSELKPKNSSYVSYLCKKGEDGAVLFLPVQARRQDVRARGAFGQWIIKHIDDCLAFTRQPGLQLGIERMEDIILVTGCHRTRSWANAVFLESQEDEQVSFEAELTDSKGPNIGINWKSTPDQGAMLNWGPEGKNLPEDQCIFIRGFRVTRTFQILPKRLVASAGPSSDPDEYDYEPESDLGLTSLPTITKYRDPLHVLLEHVAERVPNCELVVVHDDDLARIREISDDHGSFQFDALVHLLQKSKPDIIQVSCDWPNSEEYSSKNGTEPATIAMFSREFQEWGESHISPKGKSELRRSQSLELFKYDPFDIPILADSQLDDSQGMQEPESPLFFPDDSGTITDFSFLPDFSHEFSQAVGSFTMIPSTQAPLPMPMFAFGLGSTFSSTVIPANPGLISPSQSEQQRGPVIPQKWYKPDTSSDRRRYVDEVNLEPSIHFYMQKPDKEGIPLKDAMHGRFARLEARDDPMFQDRGPSISLRLNWPGYQPWGRQIPTRDFRNPPGPVTRAKLAKNVAKSVSRFIAEHKGRPMEEDGDPAWAVGPGKIDVFDLVLLRLDHVSKGSWQVQLQLIRPLS